MSGIPIGYDGLERLGLRYRTPRVTLALILINAIVYFVTSAGEGLVAVSERWVEAGGFIPLLVLNDPLQSYRFLTSMFLHGNLFHIFFNMYYLYIFGRAVENTLGPRRFLALYLASGIVASVFHTAFSALQGIAALTVPAVGASGAISGVLGAYLMLYPGTSMTVCWWYAIFPLCFTLRASTYLLFWFAIQVIYGYLSAGSGVAFFAHAGGFLGGIALLPLLLDRAVHMYLRLRTSVERFFGFIRLGSSRGGIGTLTKAVMSLMIAALVLGGLYTALWGLPRLAGPVYAVQVHTDFTVGTYGGLFRLKGSDQGTVFVTIHEGDAELQPVGSEPLRVLMNRLVFSGLIFSRGSARAHVYIKEAELKASVYGVTVPVIVRDFEGVYDGYGFLIEGRGSVASWAVAVGVGRSDKYYEFSFVLSSRGPMGVGESLRFVALVSILVSLAALYVVVYKDRELVIVS